ncbi:crossover junction endodeoxyribonuclease RuvC [Mycobacteroides abscessus]|uniref:crossover junction endodeoxyribonuclease RuvC n=1 Tax=Mycobacteroides abscessus TaxID=36809 RepID=UPI00092A44DE|nr:crossover junction endodeoxyribonuclease RuvC [Mycobacteroides abscessus]QST89621.1 RuvC-like resolvase [Mycobacterium phage prophi62-3]QST89964.1 RuvC-like resolvase [Mycobacterium phage prophi108-1]MBN7454297.1 crossover junction endodeoxyribonuclease RuvC [Mycobacteroides abscessus subsp. abscessus]MBN7542360.1 crossover junction endodeoxyribonuclease RuvC [Mycobacteroides abscessus subsp. abscessus]MBN7569957.1 crossover junction endodeoxyribonuclease RuvC [Mycobacteroides abscessus sub
MTIVLGIDPSLRSTGLAVLTDGQPTALHSIGYGGHDGDSYATRSRRVRAVCRAVIEWALRDGPPDLAVIEGPAYGQFLPSTFDRSGLWHGLFGALDAKKVPVAVVPPQTRAKWATGNGRAEKGEVLLNVREWFGPRVKVVNHDIADAAVLALMGAFRLGEAMPFTVKPRHYAGLDAAAWPK